MDKQLMMPSEALDRKFELPDEPLVMVQPEQAARSLHGFKVGNMGFLLPAKTISELFHDLPYCRLPNTSSALVGMANVRGDFIPLFDLNELFGIAAVTKLHRRFLIVGSGEEAVGIQVEGMPVQVTLSEQHKLKTLPPLPEALRPHVRACYQLDGIWVDWNVFGYFTRLTEQI